MKLAISLRSKWRKS